MAFFSLSVFSSLCIFLFQILIVFRDFFGQIFSVVLMTSSFDYFCFLSCSNFDLFCFNFFCFSVLRFSGSTNCLCIRIERSLVVEGRRLNFSQVLLKRKFFFTFLPF